MSSVTKWNCLLLFGFLSSFFPAGKPAFGSVKIQVAYSESANIFDIMDNVSNWFPGFCEETYQEYWNKKYPLSSKDSELFAKYKSIRERYYNDPDQLERDPLKNRNGMFALLSTITADPLGEAFYSSETLDEAFVKLVNIIKSEEIDFLKGFYSTFADRYKPILSESDPFRQVANQVSKSIVKQKIASYFKKVSSYFKVKANMEYRVLFTWWPPNNRSNASPTGSFLIMRYNPVTDLESAKSSTDIIFHEIVHTISARQDLAQKQTLTKEFVTLCDTKGAIKKLTLLEEPLAVVIGQALFLQTFQPKNYNYDSNWYNEKWVNLFSKLIYQDVKDEFNAGRTISDGLIPRVAKRCKEVLAVVGKFEPKK